MVRMHLAEYFKQKRLEMGLSVADVVKMLGYKNISKGMRRINAFEEAGFIHAVLLAKLAKVLGIDDRTVNLIVFKDYKSWLVLMNMPIVPRLFRRALYGGGVVEVPRRFQSAETSERYASHFAMRCGTDVCLMMCPRVKLWFGSDGSLLEIIEEVPDDI